MQKKLFVERVRNYVGGQWKSSANPEHVAITNPATGEALGSVPMGAASDVDDAVKAAKAAFPAWRELPAQTRSRYLFDLRNLMEKHYDELLAICTQEHGKTLEESKGDVRRGIDNVEVACGTPAAMLARGRRARADRQRHRLPLGAAADGRLRDHRPVQLPVDGPLLVSALRHRDAATPSS